MSAGIGCTSKNYHFPKRKVLEKRIIDYFTRHKTCGHANFRTVHMVD